MTAIFNPNVPSQVNETEVFSQSLQRKLLSKLQQYLPGFFSCPRSWWYLRQVGIKTSSGNSCFMHCAWSNSKKHEGFSANQSLESTFSLHAVDTRACLRCSVRCGGCELVKRNLSFRVPQQRQKINSGNNIFLNVANVKSAFVLNWLSP